MKMRFNKSLVNAYKSTSFPSGVDQKLVFYLEIDPNVYGQL